MTLALTEYGGRVGAERQPGLVEQVVAAAFQTFAGQDPHPTPFEKAAMLVRGITQGHPFQDANKRTGFLVASYYLAQMGYELIAPCRKPSSSPWP
jgi:death-on-curing protein